MQEIENGFDFSNLIFTDESKIQMEKFAKKAYRNPMLPVRQK